MLQFAAGYVIAPWAIFGVLEPKPMHSYSFVIAHCQIVPPNIWTLLTLIGPDLSLLTTGDLQNKGTLRGGVTNPLGETRLFCFFDVCSTFQTFKYSLNEEERGAPNEEQVLKAPGQSRNVYLDGWAKSGPAGLSCEQYRRFSTHVVSIKKNLPFSLSLSTPTFIIYPPYVPLHYTPSNSAHSHLQTSTCTHTPWSSDPPACFMWLPAQLKMFLFCSSIKIQAHFNLFPVYLYMCLYVCHNYTKSGHITWCLSNSSGRARVLRFQLFIEWNMSDSKLLGTDCTKETLQKQSASFRHSHFRSLSFPWVTDTIPTQTF